MSRSTSGNLWIATDSGLAMAHSPLVRSAPPPAVTIQSIIANRRAIPAESTKTLVAEGEQVEFQYTAVELTSPERLVFRHRLEGFRAEWTPAEPRRAATFTNLRPGDHRFCVAASLNGIDWGDPACQVIYAPPKFYQTWLFYLTASALGCAVFGGTYYLRVRSIQERFRAILEERMRVARELHDTLLQGFAGISYQLEVACRQMETAPQASRERIERAMDHADHSIAQARRAISLLRLSQLELGISAAVMAAGTQLTSDTGIRFSMNNARLPGTLPHHVEGTLYLIACEAIQNAVKHATPRLIEVSITQATTAGITLRIADDGKGFVVKEGMAKTGHWGLQGMAERARSIEAQFKIDSAPGQGTVVQVQVQSAPLLKKLWTPRWFRDAK